MVGISCSYCGGISLCFIDLDSVNRGIYVFILQSVASAVGKSVSDILNYKSFVLLNVKYSIQYETKNVFSALVFIPGGEFFSINSFIALCLLLFFIVSEKYTAYTFSDYYKHKQSGKHRMSYIAYFTLKGKERISDGYECH